MSTAARKARKRAGIPFERTPKVATVSRETRAEAQERRRGERSVASVTSRLFAAAARAVRANR